MEEGNCQTDRQTDVCMYVCIIWMDGCMDVWMDVDGWILMDGR